MWRAGKTSEEAGKGGGREGETYYLGEGRGLLLKGSHMVLLEVCTASLKCSP